MDHPNVAVGKFFIHELHAATLCKTIIVLGRGAIFCRLKVFTFWVQAQWDVSPLNKIGKTQSVYPRNKKLHLE